jgi:hypothetical protein
MYILTNNRDKFLLHDSNTVDENRTLTLSTRENLRFLPASPIHFHDGTFKTSPREFPQLLTIQRIVMGHVMPSVLPLPARKTEDTYRYIHQWWIFLVTDLIKIQPLP